MENICLAWSAWTSYEDRDCAKKDPPLGVTAYAPFLHNSTTVTGLYQKTRTCLFRDKACVEKGSDCIGKDQS